MHRCGSYSERRCRTFGNDLILTLPVGLASGGAVDPLPKAPEWSSVVTNGLKELIRLGDTTVKHYKRASKIWQSESAGFLYTLYAYVAFLFTWL
jgi:hypothetical protein